MSLIITERNIDFSQGHRGCFSPNIIRGVNVYKVGVCGHFGEKQNLIDGQTVKTKIISEELKIALGSELVQNVDTHKWRSNPIALLFKCFLLLKNCKNVILMPAQNGVNILVPLFLLLNKIFRKKLHYVVIGGWLPELLEKNKLLRNMICKIDVVYVETYYALKSLSKLGLINVKHLPNLKRLKIVSNDALICSEEEPYKLCTFSRVMKEKGIEDAIIAVNNINKGMGRVVYMLHIYGPIDTNYQLRFNELRKEFPEHIEYKGVVNYTDSVDVLKRYFLLIFPTHYKTEGMPGSIIDAYAAGVPVVTSKWNSACEFIEHRNTGFIYNSMSEIELEEMLVSILKNPKQIAKMKNNCLVKANRYSPQVVIGELIKNFR